MKKPEWQLELLAKREVYYHKTYPEAVKAGGVPSKKYRDTTANELTKSIIDFILYSGGDAQRINTTGIMRKIKGKMTWTTGGGRKGAADIHAVIKGRAVSIEVKVGKDRMSEHQHKERERIERAGGLYFVASDMENFLSWYKQQFEA